MRTGGSGGRDVSVYGAAEESVDDEDEGNGDDGVTIGGRC